MTPALSPIVASLLEKAATDNGFDRVLERDGGWLPFASTLCPLRVWLSAPGAGEFVAVLSQQNVLHTIGEHGAPVVVPLPIGAVGACAVPDVPALHRLLRRAFQLSRALPDELLHTFQKRASGLPTTTEAERLVVQRIGQNLFREGLLDLWEGRCAVTGLAVPELLCASHIKPWAECDRDAERLDVYNGILLAAHLDAAFDRGLVTFDDAGLLVVSSALDDVACTILGLDKPLRMRQIEGGHRRYLPWHRERVFRGGRSSFPGLPAASEASEPKQSSES